MFPYCALFYASKIQGHMLKNSNKDAGFNFPFAVCSMLKVVACLPHMKRVWVKTIKSLWKSFLGYLNLHIQLMQTFQSDETIQR